MQIAAMTPLYVSAMKRPRSALGGAPRGAGARRRCSRGTAAGIPPGSSGQAIKKWWQAAAEAAVIRTDRKLGDLISEPTAQLGENIPAPASRSDAPAQPGDGEPSGRPRASTPLAREPPTEARRVLLKLRGEALQGRSTYGIDPHDVREMARQVAEPPGPGVELAIVIGGGNIFRGRGEQAAAWTARPGTTWACWRRS